MTNYFLPLSESLPSEDNEVAPPPLTAHLPTIRSANGPYGLTLAELVRISEQVHGEFQRIENRTWTVETTVIELMKQVGDLSRRFLTYEGYYLADRSQHPAYQTDVENIGNELADILHSVFLLSAHYGVDLERAVVTAHQGERAYMEGQRYDGMVGEGHEL